MEMRLRNGNCSPDLKLVELGEQEEILVGDTRCSISDQCGNTATVGLGCLTIHNLVSKEKGYLCRTSVIVYVLS